MEREQPIRGVFFRAETGTEPVREWLKDLSKKEDHRRGHQNGAV
jgi:hypothetical protein